MRGKKQRILILGGTGMLGHALLRYFTACPEFDVHATVRSFLSLDRHIPKALLDRFHGEPVDADDLGSAARALEAIRPDAVINCIGIIKQLPQADDPLAAISMNALFPHQIAALCRAAGARMIHMGTDCVFDGKRGMYTEEDPSDADDLYGRTKFLGEVAYPHCVTLRTSIIGHELRGGHGLLEWFLAQSGKVHGYRRAIYSGFPTVELAGIIARHVLVNPSLTGIYHVSSDPISKYDLLCLVAKQYCCDIEIEPDDEYVKDLSLDSSHFRCLTGYRPPSWEELVERMHDDFLVNRPYYVTQNT